MKKTFSKNLLIILILIISISGVILPRELNNSDEIWNYNFARNIADGLLPYRDFNIVTTPLLPIICGLILKVTFNELIIMRILAVLLVTSILYMTYKIFALLKVNEYINYISIIGIYLLFKNCFCIDYNYAVLLIILITIYYELLNISKGKEILKTNKRGDLFLGILVGISILFKQTTGLFLSVIFIFYKLLLVSNVKDFKVTIKIILIRMMGVLIPILLFLVYLVTNNILLEFLDYTLFSLNKFSNKTSYLNLINGNYGLVMAILSIIVPLAIIVMYIISVYKEIENENQNNIFILFCYSVASMIVVYPISDKIHFLIGSMPSLITILYMIYLLSVKIINKCNKSNWAFYGIKCFIKVFCFSTVLFIIIYSVATLFNYIKESDNYNELKHFKYIPTSISNINLIDDFIIDKNQEGKKVYILDATAAIYMIPVDKYNKDFDMFNKGNFGRKDQQGLINILEKDEKNIVVLILNDKYNRNWQTPEKVIDFIKYNYKMIGKIDCFDIYENNK